jgi:uncharacterized sulfatase
MRRFNADAAAWASPPDQPLLDWQARALTDFYDAEVAAQDAHLGRLLRALRETGALANTLVIIAADHGEAHGDHEIFGHGFKVHQELVHVPLVVRHPDHFPAGATVETSVSTRRVFHTVLDAAGIAPPLDEADSNANVAGLTLARAGTSADAERDLAFSEAIPPMTFIHVLEHRSPQVIDRLALRVARRGVYDGAHKLVMAGERVESVYDVARDPLEADNQAGAEPTREAALKRRLRAFIDGQRGGAAGEAGGVSAAVEEQLRALGYIE